MICSASEINEQDRPELRSNNSKIVQGHANKTLRQVDLCSLSFLLFILSLHHFTCCTTPHSQTDTYTSHTNIPIVCSLNISSFMSLHPPFYNWCPGHLVCPSPIWLVGKPLGLASNMVVYHISQSGHDRETKQWLWEGEGNEVHGDGGREIKRKDF